MSKEFKGPFFEEEKEIKSTNILWEQWEDVYQKALDDLEKKVEEEYRQLKETNPEEAAMLEGDDLSSSLSNITTISTPFGWAPIGDSVLASTRMKFWMGHTNFQINKKHALAISKVNGVESIEVYTTHRFRVSIGLNFVDRDVMNQIEKAMMDAK